MLMLSHAVSSEVSAHVCFNHLAFGNKLFPIVLRRISRDLTCPQGEAHCCVGTTHNAQGQEVD